MEPSDSELISRAQRGEVVAFEQLVYRYDRNVLSIAQLYARDEEDAKDIYQEALIRVYRGLGNFRGDSQFATWLYRVVTNVCSSYRRKDRNLEQVSLERDRVGQAVAATTSGGVTPEKLYQRTEISAHVSEALETLPKQQRLVFILRHFQGLKLSEIAVAIDRAEGTVKRYLFLATRKLREELRDVFEPS
jgi:RNA polymerase sigma-70 factor (ECF subfamily)